MLEWLQTEMLWEDTDGVKSHSYGSDQPGSLLLGTFSIRAATRSIYQTKFNRGLVPTLSSVKIYVVVHWPRIVAQAANYSPVDIHSFFLRWLPIFKKIYSFIWERERTWAGGAKGEGERISSRLHTQWSPTQGSISGRWDQTWAETKSWMLNWLRHPGAPMTPNF